MRHPARVPRSFVPALTRREFLALAGALAAAPGTLLAGTDSVGPFRIRAITAGINLGHAGDLETLETACRFLVAARNRYRDAGFEVQTVRIATQPLAEYLGDWRSDAALDKLSALDAFAAEHRIAFSVGPVITGDEYAHDFPAWAAEAARRAPGTSFSVFIASEEHGVHYKSVTAAARAIQAIAGATDGGEGNFNFAATAFCPPGTPFFPAAWHHGDAAFAIGLESPNLLSRVFSSHVEPAAAGEALGARLDGAMKPLQSVAEELSAAHGRRYLGIDSSPAPGLDASIGAAIEALSGVPFGEPPTLSACAVITGALRSLSVRTCGYSGLMLPVLEDVVLARRAAEGRYGVSDLLLYSSVCGTGLDVVPLPGDTDIDRLAALVGDVASLAARYRKPLSARLLPMPGRKAGDRVSFDNPHLTDCVVMAPS